MPMRNPANLVKDAGRFLSAGDKLSRSGLSLRHMRMIVALDDHGRVSAAAQVMNISQPAASRIIAEMESALEVKLAERLPRGIQLTPYCKALAKRARSILLEMREADREISELKAGKGGSVFLGAVTAPEDYKRFAANLADPLSRKRDAWSYIDVNDLAEIVHRCVETDGLGFQIFNATNDRIIANEPTEEFLAKHQPQTPLTRPLPGYEAPLSNRKARELLGFREAGDWRRFVPKS